MSTAVKLSKAEPSTHAVVELLDNILPAELYDVLLCAFDDVVSTDNFLTAVIPWINQRSWVKLLTERWAILRPALKEKEVVVGLAVIKRTVEVNRTWNGMYHSVDDLPAITWYGMVEDDVSVNTLPELDDHVSSGRLRLFCKKWYRDDLLHRDNGPAQIIYYRSGAEEAVEYYRNGKHYRDGGLPTVVDYYENGQPERHEHRVGGKLHRTDGPAVTRYNKGGQKTAEKYYVNGRLHRTDGPAIIGYYESGNVAAVRYFVDSLIRRQGVYSDADDGYSSDQDWL